MTDTKNTKPISWLKNHVKELTLEEKKAFKLEIASDDRKAVQQIVAKIDKEIIAYENECTRSLKMYEMESVYKNKLIVAGVDEVGRGPLAGPVVTACVVLPEDMIYYLNDSKKVKESLREALYDEIMSKALAVGVGIVDNKRIDEVNILNATKEAMKSAIDQVDLEIGHLFIDAVELTDVLIPQTSVIKGDEKVASIAAASIIAKVTRDRMMVDYDKTYPDYDFAGNKGYGTAKHYAGLDNHGITPIHRMSFLKKYNSQ